MADTSDPMIHPLCTWIPDSLRREHGRWCRVSSDTAPDASDTAPDASGYIDASINIRILL